MKPNSGNAVVVITIIVGGLIALGGMVCGLLLAWIGAKGESAITVFGQVVETTSVAMSVTAVSTIAAVMIVREAYRHPPD